MKVKNFLPLVLLLVGIIVLSACAPAAPPEAPPESSTPEEDSYPEPAPAEPQEPSNPEGPYPYPAPEGEAIQPGESGEPYPAPQEVIGSEADGINPYPGIEIAGNTSEWDLSEALTSDQFAVHPDDGNLHAGPVYIDRSEIIMKESDPLQVELIIAGNLPTPCNQLRIVHSESDESGHIEIEAYSLSDPDLMCAQVLQPFIAVVPLGEYTEGTFSVSINNEIEGEFKLP